MQPFDAEKYVHAAALAAGITLTPDEVVAVSAQFTRIHALAQLVLAHPLAPEDELAPQFEP